MAGKLKLYVWNLTNIMQNIRAKADKLLEEQQSNVNDNHFGVNSYCKRNIMSVLLEALIAN
jgi:hypothetical protein